MILSTNYIPYLIFIGVTILSYVVHNSLQSKFTKYSRMPLNPAITGREVAEKMLSQNHINDVRVISTNGTLTDHFNPAKRTVNLSHGVYETNSISAAAVAAHECGHAVQHATGYSMLRLRSALVPVVSFASQWMSWILLGGLLLMNIFPPLMYLSIAAFALTAIFSIVTLPVEIDASRRAIKWLESAGITQGQTTNYAKDALKAAAYTYVVGALGSLASLVYYGSIFLGNRR